MQLGLLTLSPTPGTEHWQWLRSVAPIVPSTELRIRGLEGLGDPHISGAPSYCAERAAEPRQVPEITWGSQGKAAIQTQDC